MRHSWALGASFVALLALAVPAVAHHSFSATYDPQKAVTLTGVVREFHFRNPHIWINVDVPGDNGSAYWQCEGGAPNQLYRNGWTKDTLKRGDQITIEGFQARNGSNTCNMRVTRLSDGRRVFAGANDGGPGGR
ncbi:MAG: hypothetical protein HY657_00090 [Acidobacteria bacterium]|nr:hypothetical protein [Acidobacteriota bacterium]